MERAARVVAAMRGTFIVEVDGAYVQVDAAGVDAEPDEWVLIDGGRAVGRTDAGRSGEAVGGGHR